MNYWNVIEPRMVAPFEWGVSDCATAACDVFRDLYAVDPMASVRGLYSCQLSAVRLAIKFGGFENLAIHAFDRAGLYECEARPGCIGFVPYAHDARLGGIAIMAEPGLWVGKTMNGYMTGMRPLIAWGI